MHQFGVKEGVFDLRVRVFTIWGVESDSKLAFLVMAVVVGG